MQILHRRVNCTFHTESRQVGAKRAACQVIFWLTREAPGAKSGFAFPGTSALYVTLTQIPPSRIDSAIVCMCTCNCLLLVCFAGWALEGLIMRSETLEAASANTLRAARPIGWANSVRLTIYFCTSSGESHPSRMQPARDIAKQQISLAQVIICRRRRDFFAPAKVPRRLRKCVRGYLWQQPYIITRV